MTWVEIVQIVLAIIACGFVAGFIETWWQDRKRRISHKKAQEKD